MTPPRLTQLRCPACAAAHWTIDSDFGGIYGVFDDYLEREYRCPACGYAGAGHAVLQQSPPEFLLQPHPMYPMRRKEFDHWAEVLRTHFPGHPLMPKLGNEFRPNTRVFRTKLYETWLSLRDRARRRMKLLWVDLEGRLPERLYQRFDSHPSLSNSYRPEPLDASLRTVSIYISYSHFPEDSGVVFDLQHYLYSRLDKWTPVKESECPELAAALRQAVSIWCDRRVSTGTGWQDVMNEREFEAANYILMAVSPDYLASEYCRRQIERAEERERAGTAKVIPVLLCPAEWRAPAGWRLLPRGGEPVSSWPGRNKALEDIAEGILELIPAEVQAEWVDDDSRYDFSEDATSSDHR